jgi:hypothetical protein
MEVYFTWKYVIKIAAVAFLIQFATYDLDYAVKFRATRAPIPVDGTFEERGLSGVSAIHAVLQPNGNIFLFGRHGPGGLV